MVYDVKLRRMLLLDCYPRGASGIPTSIWGWNGKGWDLLESDGPPGRDVGGAAYDGRRDRVVVYGGLFLAQPDCNRQTWEWDGADWAKLEVESPRPCNHFKMTYDAARGEVVLFGGQDDQQRQLAETWLWDGASWRQAQLAGDDPRSRPVSRAHFGFVYDPGHEQTFLYGGYNGSMFEDFWSWNGSAWQALSFTGPGTRSHIGMAMDENAVALVIFGGATTDSTYDSLTDETWVLTGGAWTQAQVEGPSRRGLPAMAYDPGLKKILLYGGFTLQEDYADTWAWDGKAWSCLSNCP